jgi:predicted dehydrogenase
MSKISVGVIGCGYWGPNLIRNFAACPLTEMVAVCDADPQRLERVGGGFRDLKKVQSVDELLELNLDAVAIATPVSTHYPIASRCLEAGLHVLVEKPLADNTEHAESLVEIADRNQRILMVDHTYLFGGPIRRIKQLVDDGELGDLIYVDGTRINLGLFQRDVNVIWDLAPHDLSIMDYVLGTRARSISAWGCSHANPLIEDIAYINVDFDDALMANFQVNWLSPVKVRQMIFAGTRKSLVFNELSATESIKIYDRGIEVDQCRDAQQKLQVGYRTGDMWSPHIEPKEALQSMVTHFADCILNGTRCDSDGRLGLRIVRYLDAATRSIRAQGGRVVLGNSRTPSFVEKQTSVEKQTFVEKQSALAYISLRR